MFHSLNFSPQVTSLQFENTDSLILLQGVFAKMTEGVVIFDNAGVIKKVNPAIKDIFNYCDDELLGQHIGKLIPSFFLTSGRQQVLGVLHEINGYRKNHFSFPMELTLYKLELQEQCALLALIKDLSEPRLIQDSLWSMHDDLERRVGQRTAELEKTNQELISQVVERKRIQEALSTSEERLRTVVTTAPVVLFSIDKDGIFTLSEGKGLRRLGIKSGGLVGLSIFEVFEQLTDFPRKFQRALAGEKISPLLEIKNIIFECWYSRTYDENRNISGITGVATDITERKRVEQRLVHMANYDPLTGLPNRTLFQERLSHALAQAERNEHMVALLFLDLDRFKMINDSLGHHAGDALLKAVAGRLQANARAVDTVSRLGGDEFTIILEGIKEEEHAKTVARKILEVMNLPFQLENHEVFVTTSLGITIFPLDGSNMDELLKNADTAMYRAKDQGRNNYKFYTSDMNSKAVDYLAMESNLRHALERNELELHYQPQIDIHSHETTCVEALLRWNHPTKGFLYPSQFMSVAEETGMIISIGKWVLEEACRQAKKWQSANLNTIRIAVNLSVLQFRQKNIVETIAQILKQTRLDPDFLELEITESFLFDNVDTGIKTLQNLRNLGVQLAIDDFGTGYSSLNYLKKFPLHSLKIDQSFIQDISLTGDAPIAEAIVRLAQSLHLKVIAEGVETEEQLYFLRTRGCDLAQGFLISKPLPAHKIANWYLHNNTNRNLYEQESLWPSS